MKSITAILIDDEPDAREVLKTLLQKNCPDVELLASAANLDQGLYAIEHYRPQLVFLDITMPDGTGFQLLERAKPVFFDVIFITAHNEYAIEAIRRSALDYLLKPVRVEELINAVGRFKEKHNSPGAENERINLFLEMAGRQISTIGKIAVPVRNGFMMLDIDDIIRCEAERNYTKFYLKSKEKLVASQTLKEYEALLTMHQFLRVHKSHLINLKYVKQYIKGEGGTVVMTDGSEIEVSRRSKEEFLKKIF